MLPHRLKDNAGIIQNRFVGKSQDSESSFVQPFIAASVGFFPEPVDSSVEFDDKFQGRTTEIGDIRPYRHLPAEFQTGQAAIPQQLPHRGLGHSRLAP